MSTHKKDAGRIISWTALPKWSHKCSMGFLLGEHAGQGAILSIYAFIIKEPLNNVCRWGEHCCSWRWLLPMVLTSLSEHTNVSLKCIFFVVNEIKWSILISILKFKLNNLPSTMDNVTLNQHACKWHKIKGQ